MEQEVALPHDEPSGPSMPLEEHVLDMLATLTVRLEQVQHDISILRDMVVAIERRLPLAP